MRTIVRSRVPFEVVPATSLKPAGVPKVGLPLVCQDAESFAELLISEFGPFPIEIRRKNLDRLEDIATAYEEEHGLAWVIAELGRREAVYLHFG